MTARKILLVEDDSILRAEIARLLEEEGYSVTAASNGADALLILRHQEPPNLILLDLMLPFVSGWELSTELARDAKLAQIPLLVLSAVVDAHEAALLRLSPQNYLKKPFQTAELLAAVGRLTA